MSLLLRTNRYRLATEVLFHQYPLQHPMPALRKDDTPTEESLIFSTMFLRRRTYRFRLFLGIHDHCNSNRYNKKYRIYKRQITCNKNNSATTNETKP